MKDIIVYERWKWVCILCHRWEGNPNGRHIYYFCRKCL